MQIFGIGVDIVNVARMDGLLARYGERFPVRILHEDELDAFEASAQQSAFLAKRFAAKEAVSKAMGTGFRNGMSLRDIAVGHDALGRPLVTLSGKSAAIATELGICDWFISLADERDVAIAYVTAMTRR